MTKLLTAVFSLLAVLPQASTPPRTQRIGVTVVAPNGALVNGLRAQDFAVEEDGQRREIVNFIQDSDVPVSLGILIDKSASMRLPLNIESQTPAPAALLVASAVARVLLRLMRPDDEFILMTFDERVQVRQNFTSDRQRIGNELDRLRQVGGATHLYRSVVEAIDRMGSAKNRKKGLVLITDGYDTSGNPLEALQRRLAPEEIQVFTIGVRPVQEGFDDRQRTSPLVELVLHTLSADTNGRSTLVETSELLTDDTIQRIINFIGAVALELRGQYTIDYLSTSTAPAARRVIRVRTIFTDVSIRVRRFE